MSDKKVKKRDLIKQKNKLKVTEDFRLFRYARYMSMVVPAIALLYLFFTTGLTGDAIREAMEANPTIVLVFIVCVVNMLIWYQLGNLLKHLSEFTYLESIRVQLAVMMAAQLAMFNYISFLLILVGLIRYFRWDQFSLKNTFMEIKKDKQLGNVITLTIILALFVALELLLTKLFTSM